MKIPEDLFFHEYPRQLIANNFFEKEWVTIYFSKTDIINDDTNLSDHKNDIEKYLFFWAYIVSPYKINEALSRTERDIDDSYRSVLFIDNSFSSYAKDGYEPLTTIFRFDEHYPKHYQIRIHEDLIHMFKLYEDRDNEGNVEYITFEDGKTISVIQVRANSIKIRHNYLTTFLAAKKMHLAFYLKSELNFRIYSDNIIDFDYTVTGHSGITQYLDSNTIINFSVSPTGSDFQSWLEGKKIIPYKKFGTFESTLDYKCADFQIGYDTDKCCYIYAKPNDYQLQHSKVFFKRSVLEKYRKDPDICVGPLKISLPPHFELTCDNGGHDYIWTYLKNLCSLPYSEQQYWSTYCFLPDNTTPSKYFEESQISWKPTMEIPEFLFRELLKQVNSKWEELFGWVLFNPLTRNDQHNALQRCFPLGVNNILAFQDLAKTINLVLSESINSQELNKTQKFQANTKSIMKLSQFLVGKGFDNTEIVNYLLQIQTIRSFFSDSHRMDEVKDEKDKKNLTKALNYFSLDIEKENFIEASYEFFKKGNLAFTDLLTILDTIQNNGSCGSAAALS